MFFKRTAEMITAEDALPGRSESMPVADANIVLGTPMVGPFPDGMEQIQLAMGCFWGAERFFWQLDGVYTTAVGYSGGYTPNPTYKETCSGKTGHTEAVLVVYDPTKIDLDEIFRAFWENHDPTTPNQQGCLLYTSPSPRDRG